MKAQWRSIISYQGALMPAFINDVEVTMLLVTVATY
jgi:hypothetical protein